MQRQRWMQRLIVGGLRPAAFSKECMLASTADYGHLPAAAPSSQPSMWAGCGSPLHSSNCPLQPHSLPLLSPNPVRAHLPMDRSVVLEPMTAKGGPWRAPASSRACCEKRQMAPLSTRRTLCRNSCRAR